MKGLTARSPRRATIAKDGKNCGVTSFVFPRLIDMYVQAFARHIQCEEVILQFDLSIGYLRLGACQLDSRLCRRYSWQPAKGMPSRSHY